MWYLDIQLSLVMDDNVQPINLHFKHPARILVCGPSNSGKTTLVQNIIQQWDTFFHHPVTRVVWYYAVYQPGYAKLAAMGVELREGLPESIEDDFPTVVPSDETQIVVLDDFMKEAAKSEKVLNLFTKDSHHKNITAFMMVQNLYHQGKHSVDIARNVSVAIFIVEMRNIMVIQRFLQSSYNKHQVREIMTWLRRETHGKPYSNFMIDFDMSTNDEHRLRLNIIPDPERGVFTRIFIPPLEENL